MLHKIESAEEFAKRFKLHYCGDVDAVNHDGIFYNIDEDNYKNGYVEALRICRMDDKPVTKVALIESITVVVRERYGDDWKSAMDFIGMDREEFDTHDECTKITIEAEAYLSYGTYDMLDRVDGHTTHVLVEELESDEELDALYESSYKPTESALRVDEDYDIVLDEPRFWEIVEDVAKQTFSDFYGSEDDAD